MSDAKIESVKAVMDVLQSIDKPMLQSKKFAAFMIIQMSWTALIAYAIYASMSDSVQLSMVAALGTAQNMFLSTQAYHDRHVKPAKLNAMNGSVSAAIKEGLK